MRRSWILIISDFFSLSIKLVSCFSLFILSLFLQTLCHLPPSSLTVSSSPLYASLQPSHSDCSALLRFAFFARCQLLIVRCLARIKKPPKDPSVKELLKWRAPSCILLVFCRVPLSYDASQFPRGCFKFSAVGLKHTFPPSNIRSR